MTRYLHENYIKDHTMCPVCGKQGEKVNPKSELTYEHVVNAKVIGSVHRWSKNSGRIVSPSAEDTNVVM